MKHVFPKWFYHKEKCFDGMIIYNQEQFDELGKGWVETPADFEKQKEVKVEKEQPSSEIKEAKKEIEPISSEGKEEIQVLKRQKKGDK